MKTMFTCSLFFVLLFSNSQSFAQTIQTPTIVEVKEDDHAATVYWNSKTDTYDFQYDPDKQDGIYSYKVEWGAVADGFIHSSVTPYRVHMFQPLEDGIQYQMRVSALDSLGRSSAPSSTVTFEHDPARVDSMRTRLNGFFDDFNLAMGPFEERDWNQSYSGCMAMGKVSQHINNQYHGHNVLASWYCDRGVASSRVRHPFDFTNRTGIIEFDLDGAQKNRQFWYLDLSPFSRKRDLTAHTTFGSNGSQMSDPPHLLRISEEGGGIKIYLADEEGRLYPLDDVYNNGACGNYLDYCPGENLEPIINVRKHWRVELSKTNIKILINGVPVIDGSLISPETPNGLEFEVAQVNWLTFSYNTPKDNFLLSMVHWDNFGFDAPNGYQQTEVIHNYTDGELGTETGRTGNEFSIGKVAQMDDPALAQIPIPDQILDQNGNPPISAELMFTIQGGTYDWDNSEYVLINNNSYAHPEPSSTNPLIPVDELITTTRPYSVVMDIDPADLIQGVNDIQFFLHDPRLLNIHIELRYPVNDAPSYTPPNQIYADHTSKLMGFLNIANTMGPAVVFNEINQVPFWTLDDELDPTPEIDRWFIFDDIVVDELQLIIRANSLAQLAATGKSVGISHYEIWIDEIPVETVFVNQDSPIAGFEHHLTVDVSGFADGIHELFVQAYDVNGIPSVFDAFQAHASVGEYLPTIIEIQNSITAVDLLANHEGITLFPNPSSGEFSIRGDLANYEMRILDVNGTVHEDISTNASDLVIYLNDLPAGLYFVQVVKTDDATVSMQKIIKQ